MGEIDEAPIKLDTQREPEEEPPQPPTPEPIPEVIVRIEPSSADKGVDERAETEALSTGAGASRSGDEQDRAEESENVGESGERDTSMQVSVGCGGTW